MPTAFMKAVSTIVLHRLLRIIPSSSHCISTRSPTGIELMEFDTANSTRKGRRSRLSPKPPLKVLIYSHTSTRNAS
jgi:hypothetical protein